MEIQLSAAEEELLEDTLDSIFNICRLTQGESEMHLIRSINLSTDELRERIVKLLSLKKTDENGGEIYYPIEEGDLEEDWEVIDVLKLKLKLEGLESIMEVRKAINFLVSAITDHQAYKAAIKEYQEIPATPTRTPSRLAHFLLENGHIRIRKFSPHYVIYHGLSMSKYKDETMEKKDLLEPEEYLAFIKKIFKEGLIANPAYENYPYLDSIFVVSDPLNIYGMAGLSFPLGRDSLWSKSYAESAGYQIVKRRITPSVFKLFLRSADFYHHLDEMVDTKDIFGILSPREYKNYQGKLVQLLHREDMPAYMIYPNKRYRKIKKNSSSEP